MGREFQPTLPHGERHNKHRHSDGQFRFQPTLPHGERHAPIAAHKLLKDFNPRSRTGSDCACCLAPLIVFRFQPTLPHGERLMFDGKYPFAYIKFQPTLPHGERPDSAIMYPCGVSISTHAPARGATCSAPSPNFLGDFNPRSPHGERRLSDNSARGQQDFNPRSPHGERPGVSGNRQDTEHFNPRFPHGERRGQCEYCGSVQTFQSTLPARGATQKPILSLVPTILFQPTLPARGATV